MHYKVVYRKILLFCDILKFTFS